MLKTKIVNFIRSVRLIRRYDTKQDVVVSGIVGAAIGDALGVPVEFLHREYFSKNPVVDMRGHGTHNQPAGTWSDDTSMILATAYAMTGWGCSPDMIADAFYDWLYNGKFSPYGTVFDIGGTTKTALCRLKSGTIAVKCGGDNINDNGNGSLMRILPVAFYLQNEPDFEARKQIVYDISSITHRHLISKVACHFWVEFLIRLMKEPGCEIGTNAAISQAYSQTAAKFSVYYQEEHEIMEAFSRTFQCELAELSIRSIQSSGYVVHTLEAALWSLMHADSYRDAVLTAVNLGGDTDTIGCVTGGAAGIVYGAKNIPMVWKRKLARADMIYKIAARYSEKLSDLQQKHMSTETC